MPWELGLPTGQTRRGRFNVLFSSERLLQDRVPYHARRLVPLCCLIQNSGYLFVFIGVHSRFSPDNDSLVAQLVGPECGMRWSSYHSGERSCILPFVQANSLKLARMLAAREGPLTTSVDRTGGFLKESTLYRNHPNDIALCIRV